MQKLQAEGAQGARNGHGFYSYQAPDATKWQADLREHALAIWELGSKTERK